MKAFKKIAGWKDVDNLVLTCKKGITDYKESIYKSAIEKKKKGDVQNLKEAIEEFCQIPGWRNADGLVDICREELRLVKSERKKATRRKLLIIAGAVVCAIVVAAIAMFAFVSSGKEGEPVMIGDAVYFGAYEQDDNSDNGKELIKWIVLEKDGNKALVISEKALDCKPYNKEETDVTWETCTLRSWLNGSFINEAFTDEQQQKILTTTVTADPNPEYDTNPGNPTQDKVFLLSINEADRYFASDEDRKSGATAYAVENGLWVRLDTTCWFCAGWGRHSEKLCAYLSDDEHCWWWLRSPGRNQYDAANVDNDGDVDELGFGVDRDDYAVRPALWINLE